MRAAPQHQHVDVRRGAPAAINLPSMALISQVPWAEHQRIPVFQRPLLTPATNQVPPDAVTADRTHFTHLGYENVPGDGTYLFAAQCYVADAGHDTIRFGWTHHHYQ